MLNWWMRDWREIGRASVSGQFVKLEEPVDDWVLIGYMIIPFIRLDNG